MTNSFSLNWQKKHWKKYDDTIRSSTLRRDGRSITVLVDPVIRLSPEEVKNVSDFITKTSVGTSRRVILFEYSPSSGQSFVTAGFALEVAQNITYSHKDVCFMFSDPKPLPIIANNQIIDVSELTFRENAELTRYCTLLIRCSSGITWTGNLT